MATDHKFIENSVELIQNINAAIRRGLIHGTLAEQLNFTIINIGGSTNTPLSLHRRPVRFAVPTNFNIRSKETVMAAVGIHGTVGTKVPVEFDNIAGTPVAEPTGTPVLTSSDPTVATVALDADGSSVDIFPVQPPQASKPFTITYTLGSIVFSQDFEITADLTATQGHFVTTQDSEIPLPTAPAAPPAP